MCTPLAERALRYAGSVATSVLPSPVAISAILPSCRTIPPMSCTSKWRMPSERRAASRQTANASGSTSSISAPPARRLRSSSVRERRAASSRACTVGSSTLVAATTGIIRVTSRSCLVPKIFLRIASIIAGTLYAPASGAFGAAAAQQRARVLERGHPRGVPPEHPCDLGHALIAADNAGAGPGAAAAHALGHPHVLVRQGGDRRQVRDTEDLAAGAHGRELLADDGPGAAADTGIHLVEHHGGGTLVPREDDLQGEHAPGELTAGGDGSERRRRVTRIGREAELRALSAAGAPVGQGRLDHRDLEARPLHPELSQFALHGRAELRRRLPARGAEGAGGACHLQLQVGESPLVLAQQLLVPLEAVQLGRRLGAEAEHRLLAVAVLARQPFERVQPVVDRLEAAGLEGDRVAQHAQCGERLVHLHARGLQRFHGRRARGVQPAEVGQDAGGPGSSGGWCSCWPCPWTSAWPSRSGRPTVTAASLTKARWRPPRASSRRTTISPSSTASPASSSTAATPPSATANTASTVAVSASARITSACARAPRTKRIASTRMDLPAPVSPVRTLKPGAQGTVMFSITAKFRIRSSRSIRSRC